MLRIMGSKELDGFVFRTPGGPCCELLGGLVTSVQESDKDFVIKISGPVLQNGILSHRSATVIFSDRGGDRKMLATRVIGSKICIGNYLSVLCMQRNGKRIALDFKFYGHWSLRGYLGEKNVFIGKMYDYTPSDRAATVRFLDYNKYRNHYYRWPVEIRDPEILFSLQMQYSRGSDAPFAVCKCGSKIGGRQEDYYECKDLDVLSF